jgi:hypothetical protein
MAKQNNRPIGENSPNLDTLETAEGKKFFATDFM